MNTRKNNPLHNGYIYSDHDHAERCILVGLIRDKQDRWIVADHLNELRSLAQTAGAEIVDMVLQERAVPDPAYFIGKGKVEEIAVIVEQEEVQLIIFDDELTPAQVRNLENVFTAKVIDRTALILDIFADHAKTSAAKTQVELAQLNYLLPRLTRQWQHLSRQVGGIGTKGPGETQLETDRRLVRDRIAKLKIKLDRIEQQGITQRHNRHSIFRASLIGYTNAGKSTLMNALSDADVLVEDKLFATLDTTVRRIMLDADNQMLLGDTVGFIRKLPLQLVVSFKSTFAEVTESDLLIHVIDISHPNMEEHISVVNQLISEFELEEKSRLLVFNKVDLVKNKSTINQMKNRFPEALILSARRNIGIPSLKQTFIEIIESCYEIRKVRLNYRAGNAEYLFHSLGRIINKDADEKYLYLTVKYPKSNKSKIIALEAQYK